MSKQNLKKTELVNEIKSGEELKNTLDLIDKKVVSSVVDGFKESRLRIELGMWDKGEAISGVFRGVKTPLSWRELERQTGRDHKALKRWFDIFTECPLRKRYLPIAEKRAEKWTKNTLLASVTFLTHALSNGSNGKSGIQGEDRGLDLFKCLTRHYDGREVTEIWLAGCKLCGRKGLCHQIVRITEEFFKRWDKERKGVKNDSKNPN